MRISVIIINKGERGVDETLAGLQQQTITLPYEVIIVDASNGALDDIYSKYPSVHTTPFTSKTGKKITIPEQRNVGIRQAKGDIIVFVDANCDPQPNWLERLVAPIITSGELITAGATRSTGSKTFHDVELSDGKTKTYLPSAPTINLAIARSVFKKVGYFDENLNYGSDMDFTRRAVIAGYKILFVPSAIISHDWGTLKQEFKRAYRYGEAKTRLLRKHLEPTASFMKREAVLVVYAGFIVLLPLTFWLPAYPLLVILPMAKNIRGNGPKLVLVNLVTAFGALKELPAHYLRR
ncbi:MAG TPA: glycosyltransferase [Candidatus Saccharimonadales bacterium]|jgi:GT2 family glycosyltransferase|nr:glycosyltransferase [Candidatus Saccharimonadales bacterium]